MTAQLKAVDFKPQIRQVPYWEIKALWPVVGPMLNKAIELQNEWSLAGLYQRLLSAPMDPYPMQLWYIEGKSAIVTQINVFPMTGIKKCLLFMAGGDDMESCLHTHASIEDWAIEHYGLVRGRDFMIIHGRPGWRKVLPGYELKTVCLEKKL